MLLCLGVSPASRSAAPLQDDSEGAARPRGERLGPDAMAIFWSAPARVFSTDVNYEYRQESNLLYLTGIDQEDTILVLMPGNETRKEIPLRARGGPAPRALERPQPDARRSRGRRAASRR